MGARKPTSRDRLERKVDQQVENTFPASDPYSVDKVSREPSDATPADRKPPQIDSTLVRKLAKRVQAKTGRS